MPDWIIKLIPQSLIAKQVASIARKVIVALAVLLASHIPVLKDLSEFLIANAGQYADALAAALMGLSILWGAVEKEKKEGAK
jgi:hypothetical protein